MIWAGLVAACFAGVACGDDAGHEDHEHDDEGTSGATQGGRAGSAGSAGRPQTVGGNGGQDTNTGGQQASAGEAGAHAAGEGGASGEPEGARLVIADPDAARLYVYSVPELEPLATIEDLTFADHPGFVPLEDGRVLFADSVTNELVAVQVLHTDTPRVVGRAVLSNPAIHLAVDPAQEYAAVSGAAELANDPDAFTLVRLSDFFHKPAPIPTGEPGLMLGGDPVYLYHRNDAPAQIEAYRFDELWSGTVAVEGSTALGVAPHGEAIAHASSKLFIAADDGINVVDANGAELSEVRVIPYDTDDRTGGRAYYARLSYDGRYLYSYLRDSGPDFDWAWSDWVSDAFIVDTEAETATRLEIGNGLVYRLADSARFATFVQYHPDGDFAHFLDTDASSENFQELVGRVPLETMSKTPTGPDADPWSSEAFRMVGMVPSGRWAFVTHGGDGKVSVIDTESMEVVGEIELPTALNYGGYLLGMEPGARLRDTVGR